MSFHFHDATIITAGKGTTQIEKASIKFNREGVIDRINNWIRKILHEISKLDNDKEIEILHSCGGECSKISALFKGATKISDEYKNDPDPEKVFKNFKDRYYNSPRFTKDGNKITLIFEECTCPLVREGISDPFLCNCTIGYSVKIFETLFNRPVRVKLMKSILNGDAVCKQEILLGNE